MAQNASHLPFPVVLDGDEEIVAAYSLFRHSYETWGKAGAQNQSGHHAEFLIDRSGYLRARWLPGLGEGGWDDIDRLLSAIGAINSEPPAPPPSDFHH
jgi:putative copper resistance protein D